MKVRQEFELTLASIEALDRAVERSNIGWVEVIEMLNGEGCCIWNCGGDAWVLTVVNQDDELEVVLAGGRNAKGCVGPWEAAMVAHPAHQGLTLRVDGRKGWRRHLPHWEERDGVLYRRIEQ